MTTIKITELTNIGANLATSTVIPVVNMAGTPTTEKTVLGNIANVVLAGAGGNYVAAAKATTANTVTINAQPNITSTGSLTGLTVSNANGVVNFTTTANVTLGAVGNLHITGGTTDQLLTTDGAGNLSWTTVSANGVSSELVNGNNSFVLDGDGNVVFEGNVAGQAVDRGLVWDYGANANGVNSMVRQDNAGLTVRAWTEDSGNFSAPVNIVTNQDANAMFWEFDGYGNLTLPGNLIVPTGNIVSDPLTPPFSSAITGITTGNATVIVALADSVFPDPYTGTVTISGVTGTTEANDVWGYEAVETNAFQLYTDATLTTPVDGTTWTAYVSGGTAVGVGLYSNLTIQGGNVSIGSNGETWSFNSDGTTIFPTLTVDIHNGGNQTAQTLQFGDVTQQAIITGPTPDADTNAQRLIIQGQRGSGTGEGGDVYLWAGDSDTAGGDIKIYAGDADSNISGAGGYINLAGGDGFDNGGAITLNGGISANSDGGSVSMTGGQGQVDGGPINIQGGYGATGQGGQVNILGGSSSVGQSAYGNVVIGSGTQAWSFNNAGNLVLPGNTFAVNYANGTQVSIGGGNGNTGNVTFDDNIVIGTGDEFGSTGLFLAPGNGSIANSAVQYLRVRGGDAPTHIHLDTGNNQFYDQYFGDDAKYVKLELGDAGNVVIGTDDANGNQYNWSFTSDGNLILAGGDSVIQSIANSSLDPNNANVSTMVFTPDQNYTSQSLVIDPTGPSHIHLRAPGANIDEPDANIFLGGEESSFEVGYYNGAAPNLFIHSNNNTWTFDTTGNLTTPSNLVIGPTGLGSGTGFTQLDAPLLLGSSEANGGMSLVWYENPTGPGNVVQVGLNSSTPGSMTVTTGDLANASYAWDFDNEGNLTLPSGGNLIVSGSIVSSGASPAPTLSGFSSVSALQFKNGNSNVTVNANSNLWTFDSTGNLKLPGDIIGSANANFTIYSNAAAHEFTFADDGTFYAPDNVVLGGTSIYIGPGANTLTGIEHEVFIASSNNFAYVQAVVNNVSDNGSADWVALGAKGDDTGGQASLGFTSSGFGDANYSITGNGDGYVFVQSYGPAQTLLGGGGNLVLTTGSQGTTKDIIFGTGGFLSSNIFGRISHANNSLELSRTGATITFPDATEQTTAYISPSVTGNWTLATGNNTVNLSVPINGTYSIWVRGNIPNGIVTYTATAVVTNNNVPVLGSSYGWYYEAGNALVLTSIPTQFVGTVNNISNAVIVTTTANVFTFGITNNSGNTAVVNYGYTKL